MHPALFVIIGFMGPLILVSIIGIIYGLYTNKRDNSEHGEQVASSL
ncbi:MAG: hypothetical protein LBI04_00030 [Treponema sp.]|nr:hypothetical protein [Treponema sp.]